MSLRTWVKRKEAEMAQRRVAESLEHIQESWWTLFTEVIQYSIDDPEDLLRCQSVDYAQKVARSAATLADCALAEYENRWAITTRLSHELRKTEKKGDS